jgi:hypothetical protein
MMWNIVGAIRPAQGFEFSNDKDGSPVPGSGYE